MGISENPEGSGVLKELEVLVGLLDVRELFAEESVLLSTSIMTPGVTCPLRRCGSRRRSQMGPILNSLWNEEEEKKRRRRRGSHTHNTSF